jgi:hypothetical protein
MIVDDIINEIRSLCDEWNEKQLSTTEDILPSLNRGQEKAYKSLSRVYPDPILEYIEIAGITTQEYDLPENIWEDKVLRMEWFNATDRRPRICSNVGLRLLAQMSTTIQSVESPEAHTIFSRTIRFNATPKGTYTLRIWYLREIDPLVMRYGRVTDTDSATNTIYLAEASSDFDPTSSSDPFDQYVNVVDGQTGQIKFSGQILSWDGADTLRFKTSPDRGSVMNRTINSGSIGTLISVDDYVCSIKGTCVLYFFDTVHAFIVQYAAAEMKRKLGYAYDVDQQLLKDFESEVKKTYMGRDMKMRVVQNNPNWMRGTFRRFYRGFKY